MDQKNKSDFEKVIFISFAGREKYLEIQKMFIFELLSQNPTYELHLWNFSRNSRDNLYLQELANSSNQIKIFNQYYEGDNNVELCIKAEGVVCGCKKCRVGKWTEPYKYYSQDDSFREALFVKLDDDIVFLETRRFSEFLRQLKAHPGKILSASVINNGLCAYLDKNLHQIVKKEMLLNQVNKKKSSLELFIRSTSLFKRILKKDITAINWWRLCISANFFRVAHQYFFSNIDSILARPIHVVPIPQSRFSINTIAFNWMVMCDIYKKIGSEQSMNDEAIISEGFQIYMCNGFVTSHLHFADQRASINDEEEEMILDKYRSVMHQYLKT